MSPFSSKMSPFSSCFGVILDEITKINQENIVFELII